MLPAVGCTLEMPGNCEISNLPESAITLPLYESTISLHFLISVCIFDLRLAAMVSCMAVSKIALALFSHQYLSLCALKYFFNPAESVEALSHTFLCITSNNKLPSL